MQIERIIRSAAVTGVAVFMMAAGASRPWRKPFY